MSSALSGFVYARLKTMEEEVNEVNKLLLLAQVNSGVKYEPLAIQQGFVLRSKDQDDRRYGR